MKRRQSFKFQLRPNGQQVVIGVALLGLADGYSRAVALQHEKHEAGNNVIPDTKMASWLIRNSGEVIGEEENVTASPPCRKGVISRQSHNENQPKSRDNSH